uniref:Ig-like domain-containing protein n=1 Tax=Callorhinchus milii TaxID=7868 RepID=A0A4W3GMD4_CALMI
WKRTNGGERWQRREDDEQRERHKFMNEGEAVYLQCNYTATSGSNPYLFWYSHYANKAPEYILNTYIRNTKQQRADFAKERFSTNVSNAERTVHLNISQVRVTDSAVYYCSLSPTEAQISDSVLQKLSGGVRQLSA